MVDLLLMIEKRRRPSLVGEEREVVRELVVRGDDGAVARLVELRPAGAPEDLKARLPDGKI